MATKSKPKRPTLSVAKQEANPVGSGYKPREEYRAYSFNSLKKKGDYFIFTDVGAEKSLRAQASKQKSIRGVNYRVEKVGELNGKKFKDKVLIVTHGGNIL